VPKFYLETLAPMPVFANIAFPYSYKGLFLKKQKQAMLAANSTIIDVINTVSDSDISSITI